MFLSRVQIGSFRVRVYSGRFLSVPVLSGKKNLDPKGTCKFSVRFRVGYFWVGSGSGLRVQVKMPRPTYEYGNVCLRGSAGSITSWILG